MSEKITEEQAKRALKAFDESLREGPWEKTNFLKAIGKRLQQIRDSFAEKVNLGSTVTLDQEKILATRMAARSGQIKVYISLYSSQGGQLSAWERILANLPKHIISRPIYAEEEDVCNHIRGKENKANEAYVAVFIQAADVLSLPASKTATDKQGKSLLALKNNAIDSNNIERFVNFGISYQYQGGRLIPTDAG